MRSLFGKKTATTTSTTTKPSAPSQPPSDTVVESDNNNTTTITTNELGEGHTSCGETSLDPSVINSAIQQLKSHGDGDNGSYGGFVVRTTAKNKSITERSTSLNVSRQKLMKSIGKELKKREHLMRIDPEETHITVEKVGAKNRKVYTTIFIRDIREVVPLGRAFLEIGESKYEHSFCIVHSANQFHLDVACDSESTYNRLTAAIGYLVRQAHLSSDVDPFHVQVLKHWMRADSNNDGQLDRKELQRLLHVLNIDCSKSVLKQKIEEFDTDKSGYIEFDEFVELYKHLTSKPETLAIFRMHKARDENAMYAKDLLKFFKTKQRETDVTMEQCEQILNTFGTDTDQGRAMFSANFSRFLFSSMNTAHNSVLYEHQESTMDQPLTHYYISSSHNTYLTGHQLKGKSDADMYRRALLAGCRCVELDCWDGPNGEPIIFHGHTITSKILFKEAVDVIAKHSFAKTDYPVILSLEVHCSVPQQDRMAEIMVEAFGDMLLREFPRDKEELPSPIDLKRKIILKGKRLPQNLGAANIEKLESADPDDLDTGLTYDDDDDDDDDDDPDTSGSVESDIDESETVMLDEGQNNLSAAEIAAADAAMEEYRNQRLSGKKEKKKKKAKRIKISAKLSDIVALSSKKFESFTTSLQQQPWEMHSYPEKKIVRCSQRDPVNVFHFSLHGMMRVYPKGTRFNSSNFSPVPAWNVGAQLVALNFQTFDKHMRCHQSFFEMNGGCGYILKPEILRKFSDDSVPFRVPESPREVLTLEVISAEGIPKKPNEHHEKGEIVDPFVKIEILGVEQDEGKFKTNTVWNNGWNPTWQEECSFPLHVPELAIVRFSIYDKNTRKSDVLIVENYIPVCNLRHGFRSVPMKNLKGELVDGCALFLHIGRNSSDMNKTHDNATA